MNGWMDEKVGKWMMLGSIRRKTLTNMRKKKKTRINQIRMCVYMCVCVLCIVYRYHFHFIDG
jgi:hypothetical protein